VQKWRPALVVAGVRFIYDDHEDAPGVRLRSKAAKRVKGRAAAMTTTADVTWTRDMLKSELEEQAEWRRRKAVEYPDDRRNLDSAEEYERLAKTVKEIPDDLLLAHSEAFEDAPDSERWQEMLKNIFRGFCDFANATELVQAFVDAKREETEDEESEPLSESESYLVRSLKRVLDANDVPSDVAEKVIQLIVDWEKTPTAKS
jgi:hypothetical protein